MRYVVKSLLILLSLITGGTFLYSAWTKVLPIQPFEYTIVEYMHLPWVLASGLARFIVGLEAALGGLIVLHMFGRRNFVLKAAAALLVILSVYLIWLWAVAGNDINCGCFGDEIWMSPSVSLVKNAVLLVLLAIVIRFHKGISFKKSEDVTSLLFVAGIALPFILYPMSMGEPSWLKKSAYKLDVTALYKPIKDDTAALRVPYPDTPSVNLMQGKHIIAFLSPSCPHCHIAARKMSLMRHDDTTLPFFLIIGGIASDLTEFWKETKAGNIPWMRLHRAPFLEYTGGMFPYIIWVDNGLVVAKSTYNTLNEQEIEEWLHKP